MRVSYARSITVVLAALAVALFVACGDDDDATSSGSPVDDEATPGARPPSDFEGACSLVATTQIASFLGGEATDLEIDGSDTTCVISGSSSTLTVVVEERESAEIAAAEVAEAGTGVGAEALSIGDGAYLVGDSIISSRGAYVITYTVDPPDDELLVILARGAAVRVPTPTAAPE